MKIISFTIVSTSNKTPIMDVSKDIDGLYNENNITLKKKAKFCIVCKNRKNS